MAEAFLTYAGGILLLIGSAFVLVAALGVIRLPDLYSRMHAASKAGAVGGGLILLAVAVISLDVSVAVRAIVGMIFLVLTTPLAAHLLARSAYIVQNRSTGANVVDDIYKNVELNSDNN